MQVTTEIDFDLDIDDIMREIAEEVMEANYAGFLTQDDLEIEDAVRETLDGEYVSWSDLEDGDYIRLGDRYFEGMRTDVAVLANDLEIARRSIRVLLEDRERTLGRRARRLFTLTCSTFGRMVRRVHWHMPRR